MENVYAVYDKKARARVGPLMTSKRDEPIVRIFVDALADKQLTIGQHPEDYDLVRIGMIFDGDIPDHVAESFPMIKPADKHGIRLHHNGMSEPAMITVLSGETWLAMQEKSTGA